MRLKKNDMPLSVGLIVQKFGGVKTRSFLKKLGVSSYQRRAHLEF